MKILLAILTVCIVYLMQMSTAAAQSTRVDDRQVVLLLYPDMAPFITAGEEPGTAQGEVARWIGEIGEMVGITFEWRGPMPHSRILAELEAGAEACHPNARMTPDRVDRFKFTDPILPAPQWRIITLPGSRARGFASVAALLDDRTLVMGHLLGTSLGPAIDDRMRHKDESLLSVRGTPVSLLRLLAAGRVDYVIADITAFDDLLRQAELEEGDVVLLNLPDMPQPVAGRMMCGSAVDDRTIQRLNVGIHELLESISAR